MGRARRHCVRRGCAQRAPTAEHRGVWQLTRHSVKAQSIAQEDDETQPPPPSAPNPTEPGVPDVTEPDPHVESTIVPLTVAAVDLVATTPLSPPVSNTAALTAAPLEEEGTPAAPVKHEARAEAAVEPMLVAHDELATPQPDPPAAPQPAPDAWGPAERTAFAQAFPELDDAPSGDVLLRRAKVRAGVGWNCDRRV